MTKRVQTSALLSYRECGERLGISACRVRQLEQRALRKLREALLKLGVKSALPPE